MAHEPNLASKQRIISSNVWDKLEEEYYFMDVSKLEWKTLTLNINKCYPHSLIHLSRVSLAAFMSARQDQVFVF